MIRFLSVVLVSLSVTFVIIHAYPSEDAQLIASALKAIASTSTENGGNGQAQLPVVTEDEANSTDCPPRLAGRLRFVTKTKVAQLCTGSEWVTFVVTTSRNSGRDLIDSAGSDLGRNSSNPAKSCFHILKKGHSQGDGLYWIKHPGYSAKAKAYLAYCDMTTEGGGWTLFATKVTTSYPFLTDTFTPSSAHAVNQNGAGCVPTAQPWKQVLFRFRNDAGAARVVYNRYHGSGKVTFNKMLSCGTGFPNSDTQYSDTVGGFVRHSPFENGGHRIPSEGFHTIQRLAMKREFSEYHVDSNKWLDLWRNANGNEVKHYRSDDPNASGRKCVSGVCYLDEPVWLMYR